MKGLGRNLKYWFTYFVKTFCLVAAMMIGITIVTTTMDGEFSIAKILNHSAGYVAFTAVLLVMVYAFTNVTVNYPLSVSFGSTRLPSLLGMEIAQHIITFIGLVIGIAFYSVNNFEVVKEYLGLWPLILAAVFVMHALGALISILSAKFGKTLGMILYIAFVVTCTVAFTMFMFNSSSNAGALATIASIPWALIALAGLVLDVLFFLALYAVLRNRNIDF